MRVRLVVVLLSSAAILGSLGVAAAPAYAGTLQPRITSVSPNPFSPNRDGRRDIVAFRVALPDPERVSFMIRNANGQTIQGPHTPGTLGAGNYTYHWDGTNNRGKVAGNGLYTIAVMTSAVRGGVTDNGIATATVRVDNSAPVLSAVTGNATTFFPLDATFESVFRPSVHVSQGGSLWLEVFTTSGTSVRVVPQPHGSSGTFAIAWNGRTTSGALAAAGTYRYHFTAQNAAGTRRNSASEIVHVSHGQVVDKKATFARYGADFVILHSSDAACASYSYKHSFFKRGVLLENACSKAHAGINVVYADYAIAIPNAVGYTSIKVLSYGSTRGRAPETLLAHIYNFPNRKWESVGAPRLTHDFNHAWSAYGTVHATDRVSNDHIVKVRITVPDIRVPPGEDYDIGVAAITVVYQQVA